MRRIIILLLFFCIRFASAQTINSGLSLGLLKYSGGGDWYANMETSLPNLISFCNKHLHTAITDQKVVEVGSPSIFNYPYLHLTGHGNVLFTAEEAQNLRNYLIAGGFLHISDNYGLDKFIRREMKKVFPEIAFIEIPNNYKIFTTPFRFPKGLVKVHEHDSNSPVAYGIFYKGRLVCFYDYESDLGDGWEDVEVHNDSPIVRENALKMGANIIHYAFFD